MRNCLYSIQMNIVSELVEWHDMISGSAFTTAPGCEAILEPAMDPPEYGQFLTVILEQVRHQNLTQRQQGDPRRHSTPQNSRESVFNSDITMIPGNAGQGMAGLTNLSQFLQQAGYQQPTQSGPSQAGILKTQQQGQIMIPGTSSMPHDPGTSNAQQPLVAHGQLAVSQPGAVQGQQHSSPGLVTHPIHLPPTNTAPVVGSLGSTGQTSTGIYFSQPVISNITSRTPATNPAVTVQS